MLGGKKRAEICLVWYLGQPQQVGVGPRNRKKLGGGEAARHKTVPSSGSQGFPGDPRATLGTLISALYHGPSALGLLNSQPASLPADIPPHMGTGVLDRNDMMTCVPRALVL